MKVETSKGEEKDGLFMLSIFRTGCWVLRERKPGRTQTHVCCERWERCTHGQIAPSAGQSCCAHSTDGNVPHKCYTVSYFPRPTSCFNSMWNLELSSSVDFHSQWFLFEALLTENTKFFKALQGKRKENIFGVSKAFKHLNVLEILEVMQKKPPTHNQTEQKTPPQKPLSI